MLADEGVEPPSDSLEDFEKTFHSCYEDSVAEGMFHTCYEVNMATSLTQHCQCQCHEDALIDTFIFRYVMKIFYKEFSHIELKDLWW